MLDITKFEQETWKDFNNAISLVGVIPLLAFGYLIVERLMVVSAVPLERGFITVLALLIFIFGLIFGRQLVKKVLTNVMDFNKKVVAMEQEIIERNRLSAISQTVLTLSHEINNPLMIVLGNIELLQDRLQSGEMLPERERLAIMKNSCKTIKGVIEKMDSMQDSILTPVLRDIAKSIDMIDLDSSK
jgi:signal transduction histidine kinase